MTRTATSLGIRTAAALAVTLAALSGCSGGQGAPVWTAGGSPGASTATAGPPTGTGSPGAASPGASPDATVSGTASGTASASPGSTATAWKVFTDPAKSVSFELPQEWIAQSVPPEQGSLRGALKIEVKNAEGGYLATLQTGLPPQLVPACPDDAAKPYVVISSVPVELPHGGGEGLIDPRVVFRVIQGYKFFGSYGITNMVGGADGKSCGLQNVVRGPEGKGDYSFGDLTVLKVLAPDQKVAPAKSFDTLDQAAKYVNQGSEFANVQRMLMSLKVKN
ncbi:hypothetical protein QFZ79_002704 [Arthrobacter sp. V4I6]|uniref:hypothetical protein n=1 Tax=unclassified Arthrobacter TaxID=235627 RepID=UPI00278581F4|nr:MULTISPECIES: hypothetical protein [unclassified Arthrobacter]MDQ0820412.1 hypothetical protein [Arthrobacter sp. V1I7]MDQ0854593.1 hypothetical protein [Arthrobacter sp. V4I6]